MTALLVTWNGLLPTLLQNYLNFNPGFCAIVTDEVKPAKKIVKDFGLPENMIYPYYDIKECIENFDCDLILCVTDTNTIDLLPQQVRKYGAPTNKFLQLNLSYDSNNSHLVKRALKYFETYANEFEIIATGMSYVSHGLDTDRFKKKLFNFAKASQDLYFDYQIAKFAIKLGKNIKYALIGLAPYSFHFDLSKAANECWRMVCYCIALDDTHNFWMPSSKIKKIFNPKFFSLELPIEDLDLNNTNGDKIKMQQMNLGARIRTRDRAEVWNNRNYPETRAENIKIFDDYLTLCEKNKICPIVFLPPMSEGYRKHFSKEKLAEFYQIISAAIEKYPSAIFVDGWKIPQFADIDFFNADHLNRLGAAKFSTILNDIIEKI